MTAMPEMIMKIYYNIKFTVHIFILGNYGLKRLMLSTMWLVIDVGILPLADVRDMDH